MGVFGSTHLIRSPSTLLFSELTPARVRRCHFDVGFHRDHNGRKSHFGLRCVILDGTHAIPEVCSQASADGDFPVGTGSIIATGNMTVTPVMASPQMSYPYTTPPAPTIAPGTIGQDNCLQCQCTVPPFIVQYAEPIRSDYAAQPGQCYDRVMGPRILLILSLR